MNQPHDDPIDQLLRERFDGAVPDDGFCDRVMQDLPARRHKVAWPSWIGLFAGVAACASGLWSTPMLRAGWHDLNVGAPTASALVLLLVLAAMSLLAMCWSLCEADER